jgi:Rhs element Vgr protein
VAATNAVHDSVVRYYASDWDFIVCRAEINGRIVVVDDAKVTVAAPVCSGEPLLLVRHGHALRQIDAEIDARGQYASVECASWDFNQQQLVEASSTEPPVNAQGDLDGATLAAVFGLPAYRLHSSTPTPDGELKVWADAQLLKARLARMRGQVTFRGNARPRVGGLIRLAGLGKRFNGDAFVSRVHHRIEDGDWVTEVGFGLAPGWFAEEAAAVSAPLASGMLPGIVGLQNGVVRQIDQDPDGQTRILVDVPMVGMQGEGVWARLASGYASAKAGIFFVPEIGDEVILGFVNGNPSFPIILGSLYSGKHPPPYQADGPNTNKAIVTRGQLKISMDDVRKCLVVSTQGGHSITLDDDDQSITVVDSNKNKLHLSASGIVMDSPGDITIKAGANLTLSAADSLKLDATDIKGTASDTLALNGMAAAKLVSSTQAVVNAPMVLIN